MSDFTPIPIVSIPIEPASPEFSGLLGWPFGDSYVGRLLAKDIPQRVRRGTGRIWIYRDPQDQVVGFGTLDLRDHYSDFTDGRLHPYIPLLAVNPAMEGRGHGKSIVRHLIDQAAILAREPDDCCDVLFLDVYASNEKAIKLYEKCGFMKVNDQPRLDPDEDNRPYFIMARRVSEAPL
jgi:ribosomal protein S18 acetylase RimI-like enzyme